MIRVTLDTNVLASGFMRPSSVPGELLERWEAAHYLLLISEAIVTELEDTFALPYFMAILTDRQRHEALNLLRKKATYVTLPPIIPSVATHPEDDLILATVAEGRANYLVTGDRQLQLLGSHAGAAIVSPRDFLALLERA